jgi:threonine dehydrogenase-like Zn-dependent dehydrogenase
MCGHRRQALGVEQIIIMGRHADRLALARNFGATDVVASAEAVESSAS